MRVLARAAAWQARIARGDHNVRVARDPHVPLVTRPVTASCTLRYNFVLVVGGIAQLGERLHGMQEVSGSIPLTSTTDLVADVGVTTATASQVPIV